MKKKRMTKYRMGVLAEIIMNEKERIEEIKESIMIKLLDKGIRVDLALKMVEKEVKTYSKNMKEHLIQDLKDNGVKTSLIPSCN